MLIIVELLGTLFADLSKVFAFHGLSHELLIALVYRSGFNKNVLKLVNRYLSNRE